MERDVEFTLNYAELLREKVFNLVYAAFTPCTWTPRAFFLGRSRRRWGYNITADRKEKRWHLSEDRYQQISLLNTATKLRVPSNMEEFWIT